MANRIDQVGRVVIPKRLRLEVGLEPGSRLEFEVVPEARGVLVRKGEGDCCLVCGAEQDLIPLNGEVFLCRACVKKQVLPRVNDRE